MNKHSEFEAQRNEIWDTAYDRGVSEAARYSNEHIRHLDGSGQ